MAGDSTLVRDGPQGVPFDLDVPQSGEYLPKVVRATIDGSGAASAFYAVVQVLDPNGNVKGSYLSPQIAATGSADVTWFHGLKPSSDLSTQIVRAFGTNINGQTVPAGTTANCSFATAARTSDSSKVSWSTSTVTNDTLTLHGTGWAMLVASATWPAGVKVDYRIDSPSGFEVASHDAVAGASLRGTDLAYPLPTLQDSVWIDTTSAVSTVLRVKMTNADAADSGPDYAYVGCMFFPGLSI